MSNSPAASNRFQDFFNSAAYVLLKNHLYNYLLRKKAVSGILAAHHPDWLVEVGTGMSPVSAPTERTVYTDVSITGLQALKTVLKKGNYVVADGTALPFKSRAVSHCVSSEVIEHIDNDLLALREMARVLRPGGCCLVTFPHRTAYFANDDAYVRHYRRYNLADISRKLILAGFSPVRVEKVLGPLEKITMMLVVFLAALSDRKKPRRRSLPDMPPLVTRAGVSLFKWGNLLFSFAVRLDATIMPRSMSAVLLVEAVRNNDGDV